MLYDTDVNRAALIAERLRKKVEEKPFAAGGEEIPITISLGVTELRMGAKTRGGDAAQECRRLSLPCQAHGPEQDFHGPFRSFSRAVRGSECRLR